MGRAFLKTGPSQTNETQQHTHSNTIKIEVMNTLKMLPGERSVNK